MRVQWFPRIRESIIYLYLKSCMQAAFFIVCSASSIIQSFAKDVFKECISLSFGHTFCKYSSVRHPLVSYQVLPDPKSKFANKQHVLQ